VPFIPITGTPLADHPSPDPRFMQDILQPLGAMLKQTGLRSADMKAGCAKCGACSALSSYEA
jgi:biotin synthase-related radical SAM superfamily protein